MQSITGKEKAKNQFPVPNKRWSMEVTNYRITKVYFTVPISNAALA
jgi:hypothetical protein